MLSGKQTLQSLQSGLNSVKADLDLIDQEMKQITLTMTNNQQSQTRILRELANIRLDEIKRGSLIDALDHTDRQSMEILIERDNALDLLEKSLADLEKSIEQQGRDREAFAEQLEQLAQEVVDAEHAVQNTLEGDPAYQIQLERARKADSIADEAEGKSELAKQDRIEKGKPFEKDPLFLYLWKRHYSTPDYKANPLSRALDGWVSRLCNYEDNRLNYWTLLEIPKRLQDHLENVRTIADQEADIVQELEKQALIAAMVPELHKKLEQAEAELLEHDKRIADAEESRNKLLNKRSSFVSGQDDLTKKCIDLLAAVMERQDVFDLGRAVHMTPSKEDDVLARELHDLREEKEALYRDLKQCRERQDTQLKRLKELEEVGHKFKQHRFDDLRSGFTNEALISSVLSQFLKGMLNGADLWSTIRRYQRHSDVGAWPDFGSGGLGKVIRRGGDNVWHLPGNKAGGAFRMPRNGGFSSRGRGGGFKTGGGF